MKGDIQFKKEFLKEIEEEYIESSMLDDYKSLFSDEPMGTDFYEEMTGRDIYDFPREKILEMLKSFHSTSISALAKRLSMINKYSLSAFAKNRSRLSVPNTSNITRSDLRELLSNNKIYRKYMTKSELYSKIPLLLNNSDKLLYILYYKGVYGKANSEIINLKKTDYDYSTKTLTVDDRMYELNEYEAEIMEKAISEQEYESYVSNDAKSYAIIDSEYIFRNLEGTTSMKEKEDFDINKLNNNMILRRIQMSTKHIGEKLWSSNTIYRSGIAMRILEEYGYNEIADRDIRNYKKKYNLSIDPISMMDIVKTIKEKLEETQLISKS